MFFTQSFKYRFPLIIESMTISSLRRNLKDWIRREIVDDDPYDVESLFPDVNQFKILTAQDDED
ncbi:hypothetical protein NIES1031_22545 [Chroogloeocystis siderophila 5.2 s.c.1]|jgi:hypothetical protein|uniref:Uncharacterized protein n=1 Tax=Chroogloeocystis siderophila 5.2 s.c.1 TaxID=247279 RepID=A0A1U7HBG7_9CHRO|nr:hypothetical protein NIES1031_22545 [Chroogloeocystis siderophila 5.2 s.c.1]